MADFEFPLAQLSMGMTDGEVVRWYKDEGEQVVAGEPLLEVDTGKVSQDVESPESGIVTRHVAQPGETVPIGGTLCIIAVEGA